jgi:hypothetical protein
MEQLIQLFLKTVKYAIISYILAVLSVAGSIFASGFIASLAETVLWLSLVAYLLSFIKTYFDRQEIYKRTGRKATIKDTVLFFVTGIPAPFIIRYKLLKELNTAEQPFNLKEDQHGQNKIKYD